MTMISRLRTTVVSRAAHAFPLVAALSFTGCGTSGTGNSNTALVDPPVTSTSCLAPARTDGVLFGANVNALFWEEHYTDARLVGAVRLLGAPVLRLPGGTEADYFDWELGRPVDSCRYGSCRTWDNAQLTPPGLYQRFGAFRRSTPAAFVALAREVGGTPLFVANTVTASVDDNVRWLNAAAAAGGPVRLVELANEPYFGQVEGTNNTERLFPTGASHVALVKRLATAVRQAAPGARLAYPAFVPRVDVTNGGVSPGHDARMLTWNEQVLAAGIANDVDAFALHFYPRLPARAGATDAAYLATLGAFASSYWTATLRQPQWALLPANKRLWITELNASFADASELVGSWMHALIQSQLMLLMLQDPRVDVMLQHMLTGNAQWQGIVHPGRTPDIAPAPGFTPYALTATGESLSALSETMRGATCVQALPLIAGSTVGVLAEGAQGRRAVIVNASAQELTFSIASIGWSSAVVNSTSAAPLARLAAGTAVTRTTLNAGTDGRSYRLPPFSITALAGVR